MTRRAAFYITGVVLLFAVAVLQVPNAVKPHPKSSASMKV